MELKITIRHEKDDKKAKKLREFIEKKSSRIDKIISQYKTPSEVKFILDVQKFRNKAEIVINSGIVKCTSSVESDDMRTSIENAIDSIIKQLKKRIDKKVTLKKRKITEKDINTKNTLEEPNYDLKIVNASLKPMSIDEASLQLDISSNNFVTFYNSISGEMNVLYKNKSEQLILVTP